MRVLAIAGACVACGGAVELSKIEVDDSVFISSNESALNIRKPECTYYARIARIKRQVNFARRRIYSLPCCIGATALRAGCTLSQS
jgi:hypothetical protein